MTGKSIGRLLHEQIAGETVTLFELPCEELDEERIPALLPGFALRCREREAMSIKARLAAAGLPDISKERQQRNLLYAIQTHSREK